MGVPQIPHPHTTADLGGLYGRIPHLLAEPITRDMPIGIQQTPGPRLVLLPAARRIAR
jgi:hypothetical protein